MGFFLDLIPTPYRLVAVVVALLALYGAGWWRGHDAAMRKADIAAMRAKIESLQAGQAAAAITAAKLTEAERTNDENRRVIEDFERRAQRGPVCRVSGAAAAAARRMRP